MKLIVLAIAWMAGIILADMLHLPFWWLMGGGACCGVGAWALRDSPRLRLVLLMCCAAALGGARLVAADVPILPQSIRLFNDRGEVSIRGIVTEDPRRLADGQRLVLATDSVRAGGSIWRPAEGLVLVTLPRYPERSYGDRLELTGKLTTPRAAARPEAFDYQVYLARRGIFTLMKPERSRRIAAGQGNPVLAALLGVRDQARRVLLHELPEPQAALAVGILLGLQSSIPDDVLEHFSITGTSHILVISGWNITIISAALYSVADGMKLARRKAFWAILVTIWLYTMFVGATPTVIRAAVMGSIVVLGQRLERPAHAWTTLFAACWAMTLWNPQTLWDMGFQLSALATASLFAYGKGTEALLVRTPLRAGWLDWAREALTATLAAQILALPLILYAFGNLSIIAPLANVAMLPMVPSAMLFGALALLGGMIWLPLGQWLAPLAYLFLAWLTEGARLFAQLPWAAIQLPPFPLWVLLTYYAIVVGAWLWNVTLPPESAATSIGR
ncbi:MAG: ComEC family competence protein [Chloroflexi bacterium]|nr:ComEC family competence protein [Chloroflexota bacterium]